MSDRKEYRFGREPVGTEYDRVLEFSARYSSTFSLVLTRFTKKLASPVAVITSLRAYLLDERESSSWPGTELLPPAMATVLTFSVHADAIALLATRARRLYSWQGPELPDDLCFYRSDGSILMSTIAHENDAELQLSERELTELRQLLPEVPLQVTALH